MKSLTFAIVCACILVVSMVGCREGQVTTSDTARLQNINEKWTGRYKFEFDGELYLKMVNQRGENTPENEAKDAFRAFWFDVPGANIRTTSFVYLNVYGASHTFKYQLAYDQTAGQFVLSHSEHY